MTQPQHPQEFDYTESVLEDLGAQLGEKSKELAQARGRIRMFEHFLMTNAEKMGLTIKDGVMSLDGEVGPEVAADPEAPVPAEDPQTSSSSSAGARSSA